MINKSIEKMSPLSMKRIIALILNYGIGYLYIYPKIAHFILKWSGIHSADFVVFIQFFIYFMVMISTIILAFPLLVESYQSWKYHKNLIFKKSFKLIIGLYMLTIGCSYIISLFTNTTTSNNQIGVSISILQLPYLMAFTTMIFAPMVEEVIFRGIFYRFFRTRYKPIVATLISCSAFGFIHIYDSLMQGMWNDCWYFFVYACIGIFLCRAYEETDTIFGSMFLHFLNNAIAFIVIV